MLQGIVRWFNAGKGYGFITCDSKEYFVHFKEIQSDGYKTLKEGDKVSFEPAPSAKGPLAKSVIKIE